VSARRFRLEVAGEVKVGLAFDSDVELEEFLAGRGLVGTVTEPASAARKQADAEPRPRGRPPFDDVIAAAVTTLGAEIDRVDTLRAAAGLVQRAIAAAGAAPDAVPSTKTIERFLAERWPRQK
jgi:hypothetical protein